MEKHLEKFCKQNPICDGLECSNCKALNDVPMKDFLKTKYKYVLTCSECSCTTEFNTKSLHEKLEFFKQFP